MQRVRRLLKGQRLSDSATSIVLQSWRDGTRKQYTTYLRQWEQYCCQWEIDTFSATVIQGINFLSELYHNTNLSYSAMNTARSALSLVIFPPEGGTFGNHPLVCRLLKGVFTTRPSLPRYQCIWDVAIVLKYLKTLHPPEDLHLRDLTLKVNMLIALLSGQRCQTIHALDISDMEVVSQPNLQYVFQINKLLKTSRPAKHFSHLVLQAYPTDEQLCIFKTIQVYLAKTKPLRGKHTQLLISYQKPHKPVSTDTIARWLKTVLEKAGIDTNIFHAHSTRAASTSAAKTTKLSVNTIMDAAGWTNALTFSKFYDKPVVSESHKNSENFGHNLLRSINIT